MLILGIESSCDDAAAAVWETHRAGVGSVRASAVANQDDIHRAYGGIVPELASRNHVVTIQPVVERTLAAAGCALTDLDGIAVTRGPGLVGSLLVGLMYAKGIAQSSGLPLVGVNHLEGHLLAPMLEHEVAMPYLALVVSGGHTALFVVEDFGRYRKLGATRDDAAGEAFDKVATLLGLGYPGGPAIERLAREGDPARFTFPRPMIGEGFEFSFSGLKTAVLHAVRASGDLERDRPHIARGFQDAVLDVLVTKLDRAVHSTGYTTAVLGGGVACSKALSARAADALRGTARVAVASPRLNADNAAMIARAGWHRLRLGERSDWTLDARADLPLPGLEMNETTHDARRTAVS
jgi:N6-L-threonylcarbamoyladenine synthase